MIRITTDIAKKYGLPEGWVGLKAKPVFVGGEQKVRISGGVLSQRKAYWQDRKPKRDALAIYITEAEYNAIRAFTFSANRHLNMHPDMRAALERQAQRYGVPFDDVLGGKRRQYGAASKARVAAMVEMFDHTTVGGMNTSAKFRWSYTEIARQLGMDPTTVRYHLIKAGVYVNPDHVRVAA